jgi:hypothetical protein
MGINNKKKSKKVPHKIQFLMLRAKRRDLILLLGLWSVACIAVFVVGWFILSRPSPGAGPGQGSADRPRIYTVEHTEVTSLKQYPLAEAAAQKWAADAQLISANTSWPEILSLAQVGEPTPWSYHFYSPAQKNLLLVIVDPGGGVTTIEHRVNMSLPRPPIQADTWLVDSPTALAIWLDYAGDSMLQTSPGFELMIQLRQEATGPVWAVVGLDKRTGNIHGVRIDAHNGAATITGS